MVLPLGLVQSHRRLVVKELFPVKTLVKEFAQPTVQKRFHSILL